uniref:Uncharacterized protein n=1 Tax=Ascaris lumbricoides TaxID=6252 RepID=A0A0M3ITX5_ASCLU
MTFIMRWCISLLGDNLALDETILFMTSYRFDSYEWLVVYFNKCQ